jgi:hypothetical protein
MKAQQSILHEKLIADLMSNNIPNSEMEFAAMREIEKLQRDLEKLKQNQDEPMAYLTNHRQRLNITINPVVIRSMPVAVEWEIPLYAKSQAKEWVGITDEEIDPVADYSDNYAAFHHGVEWAEKILRERNT